MPEPIDLRLDIGFKQILSFALPISASILVPQINFIANNIFLGQIGERELALAGLTGIYYLVFAVIGHGLNTGLQATLSRKAGENNTASMGSLFNQAQVIALLLSLLGIAFTYTIAPSLLAWSMKDATNVGFTVHFLQIRIVGLPFLYLFLCRNALFVSTNQSKLLIIGTAIESFSNIFFDYSLIGGHFGLPKMGFMGAAYAGILAEVLGFLSVLIVVAYNKNIRQIRSVAQKRFQLSDARLLISTSLPLMLQFGISIISWEVFYILIEHRGARALAISNTMRNLFGFFGCFTWAFASTSNNMVSNIIGQGKGHLVITLVQKIILLSTGFSIMVGIIVNIDPSLFFSLYHQTDSFVSDAIPVLQVVSVAMVFQSFSVVWLNAVIGSGDTRVNLAIEVVSIIIYLTYIFLVMEYFHLPIAFGWGSEILYWCTMFVPSYWYIKRKYGVKIS